MKETSTEPLLFWEIHDDMDRKKRNQNVKIVLLVLILFATGFGLGHYMGNFNTTQVSPNIQEEMVGAAKTSVYPLEQMVGQVDDDVDADMMSDDDVDADMMSDDDVVTDMMSDDDVDADMMTDDDVDADTKTTCEVCGEELMSFYTLETCENEELSNEVILSVLSKTECKACTSHILEAEREKCAQLFFEEKLDICSAIIAELSKEDCEMSQGEMYKMVTEMKAVDGVCEVFPDVDGTVEETCAELGVDIFVGMPEVEVEPWDPSEDAEEGDGEDEVEDDDDSEISDNEVAVGNLYFTTMNAGEWGGECTCPDGTFYNVGDEKNHCGSMACQNGSPGHCMRHNGPWKNKQVSCSGGNGDPSNQIILNSGGGFGGTCVCPNGKRYLVGDNDDTCGSLACEGGTKLVCHHRRGAWSNRRVSCVEPGCRKLHGSRWDCTGNKGPHDFYAYPVVNRVAWDIGFRQHWKPEGRITHLAITGHPRGCWSLCGDAANKLQRMCFYNNRDGACKVASGAIQGHLNTYWYGGYYPGAEHVDNMGKRKQSYNADWKRYGEWGNIGTFKCSDEYKWCGCQGVVTFVRKYKPLSSTQLKWKDVLKEGYTMSHMEVRGGTTCNEPSFKRDPDSGADKVCWCHPASKAGIPHMQPPPEDWTEAKCKERYRKKNGVESFFLGMLTGFECTGLCPLSAMSAVGKGGTVPIGQCSHACFCLAKGWGL